MTTTLPADPDMGGPADEVLGALRRHGVDSTALAVRVIALHAARRSLTRSQLVDIVSEFPVGGWDQKAVAAAGRLLADIGERDPQPYALLRDIHAAAGLQPDELLRALLRDHAIRALRDFGAATSTQAAQLLPLWHHYQQLAAGDVEQVLAAFPGGGTAHLAPVDTDPAG